MNGDLTRLKALSDQTAIVGVGASRQGNFPDSDPYTRIG
jgi:hypothetical protein